MKILKIENMLDIANILSKLKVILKLKTDLQLAQILNVKGNTISAWKNRNTLPFDTIIKLCERHNIDLNELFLGAIHLNNTCPEVSRNNKKLKIISSDMHFQYVLEGIDSTTEGYIYDFMNLKNCKIAFQIISDNMSPLLRISNFVVCESTSIDGLVPGAIYVLISMRKGISVHRFDQVLGRDKILFANDNFLHKNEIVLKKDILELWKVKSVFLGNLDS